jgi:hypothetical protein
MINDIPNSDKNYLVSATIADALIFDNWDGLTEQESARLNQWLEQWKPLERYGQWKSYCRDFVMWGKCRATDCYAHCVDIQFVLYQ